MGEYEHPSEAADAAADATSAAHFATEQLTSATRWCKTMTSPLVDRVEITSVVTNYLREMKIALNAAEKFLAAVKQYPEQP